MVGAFHADQRRRLRRLGGARVPAAPAGRSLGDPVRSASACCAWPMRRCSSPCSAAWPIRRGCRGPAPISALFDRRARALVHERRRDRAWLDALPGLRPVRRPVDRQRCGRQGLHRAWSSFPILFATLMAGPIGLSLWLIVRETPAARRGERRFYDPTSDAAGGGRAIASRSPRCWPMAAATRAGPGSWQRHRRACGPFRTALSQLDGSRADPTRRARFDRGVAGGPGLPISRPGDPRRHRRRLAGRASRRGAQHQHGAHQPVEAALGLLDGAAACCPRSGR